MPYLRELYMKAYALHYKQKDVVSAYLLYEQIISQSPQSEEAGYARIQIETIQKSAPSSMEMAIAERKRRDAEIAEQQRDRDELQSHGDAFLYERYAAEMEGKNLDRAFWGKALTIHYGDETKAKYEYIKLRVEDAKVRLAEPSGVTLTQQNRRLDQTHADPKGCPEPSNIDQVGKVLNTFGLVNQDLPRLPERPCPEEMLYWSERPVPEEVLHWSERPCPEEMLYWSERPVPEEMLYWSERPAPEEVLHWSERPVPEEKIRSAAAQESISTAGKTRIYPEKSVNWYMVALTKYGVFEGRARRKEFWYFLLFNLLIGSCFVILDIKAGTFDREEGIGTITLVYLLATFIPGISVMVRRLHDTDRSGWWWLLGLIPVLGGLVLLAFASFNGTPGSNKYGPDPKSLSP